jgi:protein gp37
MASGTSIEWTEATWNPTTGCDRISPGCDNCYAMVLAKRLKAMGQPKYQNDGDPRTSGPGFGVTVHPSALSLPLDWRGSRTVFVNSMSDLFHARVPVSFVRDVFRVIGETPQHTYQVLTKRVRAVAHGWCSSGRMRSGQGWKSPQRALASQTPPFRFCLFCLLASRAEAAVEGTLATKR